MESVKDKISVLKEQLNKEISKENSDNEVILSLSHEIASLDNDNIRFSVDAGLINRLGKELVGRHETAVAELVKNSYDADAKIVSLSFENCDKPGGKLEISDDGVGMTRDQLIKGFMTISSSDKVHNPKSVRYKRTRAGQKGIGRFATQRLGSILTVITQTKDSKVAYKVVIHWDHFKMDSNLLFVTNSIVEVPKIKEEGTVLIIEDLRDYWSLPMIKRAYRYVSDLLQPFPLSERFEESQNDPGFKVEFYKDNEAVINEDSVFYKNATAEIEGYVDKSGDGYYILKSSHFDIKDEIYPIGHNKKKEDYKPFPDLRDIHFKAYYFIYNVGLVPKQIESAIRQNAEEYGGIRLYRNGFRVLPYAERDNDWLGLDASVRKNVVLTPHGNNNFYGFVEVFDKKGKVFQELSSREGLLENDAFAQLKDFIYKVVIDSTIKISSLRGRKKSTAQKDWTKKKHKEVVDEVASVFEEEAKKKKSSGQSNKKKSESEYNTENEGFTSEDYENFAKKLRDSAEQEEQFKKQLLQEVQLLRILASLGLTIGEFVHEIKHHLRAFNLDIDFLDRNLKEDKYQKRTKRLAHNLSSFTTYTSYFDKAISENVNRELEPVALKDAVRSFYKVVTPDAARSGITLEEPQFEGYDIFTIPMHKSEWVSILFNFYTNSKKAIKRAQTDGKILITAGNVGDKVYLNFSDNGDGISLENQELIFDEFYTTSPPSGSNESEVDSTTGTGLGLKIVKDIVSGYGGEVFVVPPEDGFSTTIRIELNRIELDSDDKI